MTDAGCYRKFDWLRKNVEPVKFHVRLVCPEKRDYKEGRLASANQNGVIVPVLSEFAK